MYALRHYSLPLLLALSLHLVAAWSLYEGWEPDKKTLNVVKPPTVMANLIMLEQKAKPAPPVKRPAPPAKVDDTAAREQARLKREQEAKAAQEKARAEAERKEKEAEEDKLKTKPTS